MSTFTDPLAVEITQRAKRGRPLARLIRGFSFYVDETVVLQVPAGFETDFASTPRWSWAILPPLGRYAKAAVLHDYMYTWHPVSRRQADTVFRAAMRVLEVPPAAAWVLWASVRLFGRAGWERDGVKK